MGQAEELLATNFWDAIEAVNREFAAEGFFISHLFTEDQVILGKAWRSRRSAIVGPWTHLDLYRLGDADLLLSKLMRNDPADREDAEFIFSQSALTLEQLDLEIANARRSHRFPSWNPNSNGRLPDYDHGSSPAESRR